MAKKITSGKGNSVSSYTSSIYDAILAPENRADVVNIGWALGVFVVGIGFFRTFGDMLVPN